ncbi:uncharacterized protein LOC123702677 isoform X2 [Colias croceus]|uniref:uncharacterized protein LOC123702677 isoform X2 n=1 Tax=Colias crocea TaxID=72248 RepID=UPI001E27E31B|nr:uncharacterized protein LOC123702677 isoform X2 [Colias croceus]
MCVMPADEGVLWGALGALSRVVWIFGICPVSRSPKVEVSKWKSFYGRYILLTALTPERIRKWVKCLENMDTIIERSESLMKNERKWSISSIGYLLVILPLIAHVNFLYSCKAYGCSYLFFLKGWAPSFPSVITVNSMIFLIFLYVTRIKIALAAINHELKHLLDYSEGEYKNDSRKVTLRNNYVNAQSAQTNEPRQLLLISERIRNLAHSFSSVCEAIESVNDTTGIIVLFVIASGVLCIMAGAMIFVTLFIKKESLGSIVIHFIWCLNIIFSKFIILSEPCHSVHKKMSLMRTHLIMLQKKNIYNERITNELKIFFLLTYLNKKKISPMKIGTIDRLLTLKILQCVTTYLVAVIGLKVSTTHNKHFNYESVDILSN